MGGWKRPDNGFGKVIFSKYCLSEKWAQKRTLPGRLTRIHGSVRSGDIWWELQKNEFKGGVQICGRNGILFAIILQHFSHIRLSVSGGAMSHGQVFVEKRRREKWEREKGIEKSLSHGERCADKKCRKDKKGFAKEGVPF